MDFSLVEKFSTNDPSICGGYGIGYFARVQIS